jgi:predicted nucleic-acid-binding Zn-ribbon protein
MYAAAAAARHKVSVTSLVLCIKSTKSDTGIHLSEVLDSNTTGVVYTLYVITCDKCKYNMFAKHPADLETAFRDPEGALTLE